MNRRILHLAIPSIVSNITVPLLGLVDVTIVGHLGATAYIGAIAVGGLRDTGTSTGGECRLVFCPSYVDFAISDRATGFSAIGHECGGGTIRGHLF